jgi:hypothetical protein
VEDEHPAHSKNEVDSVKIETERLHLILTEETVGDAASMESPFKMGTPRKSSIAASKATGEEKKVPMNKVHVALGLPTNLKAVRAEAVNRSNTYHRPGESRMKTRHQKLDFSTWRCNKDLCISNSSIN